MVITDNCWTLFGIISYAFDNKCKNSYTVFVKVKFFIDWIRENSEFFTCEGGNRKRVPWEKFCDGINDCYDGSDERQCSK